ncbi:uncharacterized protein V6R79_012512 [Siganus canaliculatus]
MPKEFQRAGSGLHLGQLYVRAPLSLSCNTSVHLHHITENWQRRRIVKRRKDDSEDEGGKNENNVNFCLIKNDNDTEDSEEKRTMAVPQPGRSCEYGKPIGLADYHKICPMTSGRHSDSHVFGRLTLVQAVVSSHIYGNGVHTHRKGSEDSDRNSEKDPSE